MHQWDEAYQNTNDNIQFILLQSLIINFRVGGLVYVCRVLALSKSPTQELSLVLVLPNLDQ